MAPEHDDVAERDAHCGAGEEDDPVLGFVESLVVLDSVVEWGISDASVRRSAMLQVRGGCCAWLELTPRVPRGARHARSSTSPR
jgi:hypothetical protein